jgi:hypothetical protein
MRMRKLILWVIDCLKIKIKEGRTGLYQLEERSGISMAVLWNWHKNDAQQAKLQLLCKLRKASGKSWNQFGEKMDEIFLKEDRS